MNSCKIFQYCDLPSHDDVDKCCQRMDDYYGIMLGGSNVLVCNACQTISGGEFQKNVFYRDHGNHLGELSTPEKIHSILKGYIFNI